MELILKFETDENYEKHSEIFLNDNFYETSGYNKPISNVINENCQTLLTVPGVPKTMFHVRAITRIKRKKL